jgi:hypothetical protein
VTKFLVNQQQQKENKMMTNNGRAVMAQGRIVWTVGDLFKGRPKVDFNTKAPKLNAQGMPIMEYGLGLAIPKNALGDIWTVIHEEAYTLYPSRQIPPGFAMKYKDGDGIDDKGVSFAQREGYAGHLVFACTTTLPIKFFRYENGANILINEGIKCGDYVNVQLNIKAHAAIGQGKAGLYLNPMAVQFLGYGKEIVNTPSGDAIFGNAAPAVPTGASAMPIAPAGMLVPPPSATAAPMPNWAVVPAAHQPSPTAAIAVPAMPTMPR